MKETPIAKISKQRDGFLRVDVAFQRGAEAVLESLGRELHLDLKAMFRPAVRSEARRLRQYNPSRRTRREIRNALARAFGEVKR